MSAGLRRRLFAEVAAAPVGAARLSLLMCHSGHHGTGVVAVAFGSIEEGEARRIGEARAQDRAPDEAWPRRAHDEVEAGERPEPEERRDVAAEATGGHEHERAERVRVGHGADERDTGAQRMADEMRPSEIEGAPDAVDDRGVEGRVQIEVARPADGAALAET